jgi:hydroxymethylglutaryl-CoA reductase (NADPH)
MIEQELGADLSALTIDPTKLGSAEEKNCEQMFGHIPLPVGLAGPLKITFSNGEEMMVHLPLATTEGALVASVNRGCKVLTLSDGVRTYSERIGITRSICFKILDPKNRIPLQKEIRERSTQWVKTGEETSDHLRITSFDIDEAHEHIFLTLYADTDEAMGMNMITIAAQKIADWMTHTIQGLQTITIAGNVDSDKKPSKRTHEKGRGFSVTAEALFPSSVIKDVLNSTPEQLLQTAHAKLEIGSKIAGAIGANLHAANVIAALYLATGQDAAHVVEGSLADTTVTMDKRGLMISVRLPAILVGVRGGGTSLPAQKQCLQLLLGSGTRNQEPGTGLHPCQQLSEIVGAAVLAGEISLLAAQATQTLAKAHKKLAR